MEHDRASRFADVAEARERFGAAVVDRLVAGCFESDPAADALVRAFAALPGGTGWRLLEEGLRDGSSSREEVRALLVAPPAWLDRDRLHAGAVAYWRAGAQALTLSLTAGALAYGYQSASLSRPLVATGRLERLAPRRLAETARWLLAVTTPGGMLPGAEGYAASIRVRAVHALVRAHLLRGDWDHANWGVPISASDAASTALGGFLTIHLDAMHDLGVHYSRRELEDMAHLWAWIATVMGVPAGLVPAGYAEARLQSQATMALDSGPAEGSERLMQALLHAPTPVTQLLPRIVQGPLVAANAQLLAGFTRRWMGDAMADRLGVARTPLRHAALAARPVNLARRVAGTVVPDARLGAFERAVVARVLDQGRAAPAPLQPHEAAGEPVLRRVA